MEPVPTFSGPCQPLDITEWLRSCDGLFEESEPPLTDKQKIHKTGRAIAKSTETAELYEWWVKNEPDLEKGRWEQFQDDLKDQALGTKWRTDALKAFYTAANSTKSLEEFTKVLNDNWFILKESKTLPTAIDKSVLKYQLLFNGAPGRTERILTNDAYNDSKLVRAGTREVEEWLGKYRDQGPSPNFLVPADSGMYILSGLSGSSAGASTMNNFDSLPGKSNLLGRLSTISLGQSSNVSGTLRITGFQLGFADPALSISYNVDGNIAYSASRALGVGQYITSVKVYYGNVNYNPTAYTTQTVSVVLGIELSFSGESEPLTRGTTSYPNPAVFNAPSGWRIVGFYGRWTSTGVYYNQSFAYYTQLGVIFAPV
ncbi:hypothetical protein BDW62DRAFT_178955 [Aspergillus aurantiobrunneus]